MLSRPLKESPASVVCVVVDVATAAQAPEADLRHALPERGGAQVRASGEQA